MRSSRYLPVLYRCGCSNRCSATLYQVVIAVPIDREIRHGFASYVERSPWASPHPTAAPPTPVDQMVRAAKNGQFLWEYYPQGALKRGEQGRVAFKSTIEPTGTISTCDVTESSGFGRWTRKLATSWGLYARVAPVEIRTAAQSARYRRVHRLEASPGRSRGRQREQQQNDAEARQSGLPEGHSDRFADRDREHCMTRANGRARASIASC